MLSKTPAGVETSGSTESIEWDGPVAERDRYERYTGSYVVRDQDGGLEVDAGDKDRATHREGCRHL